MTIITEGMTPTQFCTAQNYHNFGGVGTSITTSLTGTDLLIAENGNFAILNSLLPSSLVTISHGMSGSNYINSLNANFNTLSGVKDVAWYGIEFDTTVSSSNVTRIAESNYLASHSLLPIHSLMRGCLLNDAGTVNYYLKSDDWSKKADGTASILDGTDGQVMVEIPAHYEKFETSGNTRRVKFCLTAKTGFAYVPTWYLSAYKANLNRSTNKLSSVINLSTTYRGGDNTAAWDAGDNTLLGKAVSNITRANLRIYAQNRGTNWCVFPYVVQKTLFWLFTIEFATLDSQKLIDASLTTEGYHKGGLGLGVTQIGAKSVELFTYNRRNPIIPLGTSNSLANGTGEVDYTVTGFAYPEADVKVNRYRGIEVPFGCLIEFIDGINSKYTLAGDTWKTYVTDDPSLFADSVSAGYRELPAERSRVDGFIKEVIFGDDGDILPLVTYTPVNVTYFFDRFYTGGTIGDTIVLVDNTWYEEWRSQDMIACGTLYPGDSAGFLYTWVYPVGSVNETIGTRLAYKGN